MSETDRDLFAGEYVLGVLEGDALAEAERLAASDPEFAEMVAAWQNRLAPLSGMARPVGPPGSLWDRIEASTAAPPGLAAPRDARSVPEPDARIVPGDARNVPAPAVPDVSSPFMRNVLSADGRNFASPGVPNDLAPTPRNDNVVRPGRMWAWRSATASSLALAACLALVMVIRQPKPPEMAVLAPARGDASVLVATLGPGGVLTIRPTGTIAVPAGRDLELWSLVKGETRPTSLGVLPASGRRLTASFPADTQLMVSLEPRGGSPTGQPTGPVLYDGTLTSLN